jgi:hypothetical protein
VEEKAMRRNSVGYLLAIPCLLLAAAAAIGASDKPIERFRAFAASLGTGKSAVVEMYINRWSTDQEREALLSALQESGQNKLLDVLTSVRPPVGNIRIAGKRGWDLYYARNNVLPDGSRHIVMATNRSVAWGEVSQGTRSMQYQFTVVELHIDKDGKGEGKIVPAARVLWDKEKKKIEIENYSALPVDLIQVNTLKP